MATVRGGLANSQERHAEALAFYQRALELATLMSAPNATVLAAAHNDLAFELGSQGRHAEAAREYEAALAIYQAARWRSPRSMLIALGNLGSVRMNQGRFAEALKFFAEALSALTPVEGQADPDRMWIQDLHGRALLELGRRDEARAAYADVLSHRAEMEPGAWTMSLAGRARLALESGQARAGLADAQEALGRREGVALDRYDRAFVDLTWAQVGWEAGVDRARCLEAAQRALSVFSGPEDAARRAQIEAWLKARSH